MSAATSFSYELFPLVEHTMEWRKRFLASLILCLFFGWLSFGGCFSNDCMIFNPLNVVFFGLGILVSIPLCLYMRAQLSRPYSPAPRERILRTMISAIVVLVLIALISRIVPVSQGIIAIIVIALILGIFIMLIYTTIYLWRHRPRR